MSAPANIALLGMMGVGKSTVAAELGARLGRTVVETDDDVAAAAGMSIPEIFVERGEDGFRELEREAVARAAARTGVVIALGGGAVLDDVNVTALRATGVLIGLRASTGALVDRLRTESADRPLLHGDELTMRVSALAAARVAVYERVADHEVDAERPAVEVAADVLRWAAGRGDVLTAEESAEVSA